MKVWLPKQGLQ